MNKFLHSWVALFVLAALPLGFAVAGDGGDCKKCDGDCSKCEKSCDDCPCPKAALKALAEARDTHAKAVETMKAMPADQRARIDEARKTIRECDPSAQSMFAQMEAVIRLYGTAEALSAKLGMKEDLSTQLVGSMKGLLAQMMEMESAARLPADVTAKDADAAVAAAEAAMKNAAGVKDAMAKLSDETKAKVKAAFEVCAKECPACQAAHGSMGAFEKGMEALLAMKVEMPAGADAALFAARAKCIETAASVLESSCDSCCEEGEECCEPEGCCPDTGKECEKCPMGGEKAS